MSRNILRNGCFLKLANLGCFAIGSIFFFGFVVPYLSLDNSITKSMRGNQIIIVRFLDKNQQMTIWNDGIAKRYFIAPATNKNESQVQLTLSLRQTLQKLQEDWCRAKPSTSSNHPIYEIGLRCNMFQVIHFTLSSSNTPPALTTIVEQIPAPDQ